MLPFIKTLKAESFYQWDEEPKESEITYPNNGEWK